MKQTIDEISCFTCVEGRLSINPPPSTTKDVEGGVYYRPVQFGRRGGRRMKTMKIDSTERDL